MNNLPQSVTGEAYESNEISDKQVLTLPWCPYFGAAADLLSRRWALAILRALMAKPLRFNEISSNIPRITDRILSQRLRELEGGRV
ncbi:winged helix-turn-helix transcriptional regulator [Gordonia humi]|uniref:winged helix-turn-helix transcriptional regulator n=1 Tax=Gordonia humi TaxID=686429 RepID=UPI003613A4D7